jgi:hypothetical protein
MKYGARFASSVCLATSMVFCLAVLFSATAHFVVTAHAEREIISGSVSSSPSSGPVGAIISISGTGWPDPNGEQVNFGYMIASNCLTVPDSQKKIFQSGSFSGWLRLPNGTPLGIYSICAIFGSTTAIANDYTVLSESSPQINISPSKLTMGQRTRITGSNYFPAGTTVQLFWETTNGRVVLTLKPVISNSKGFISRTFIIPTPTTVSSGSYKIVAKVVGDHQPNSSSSATFSYNTPTPSPTPTSTRPPTPQPTSNPTPMQHLSPTAVATPIVTPTIATTTPVRSQNTHTETSNTPITNQPLRNVLIGSAIGLLALLATILIIMLMFRRKKAHSIHLKDTLGPTQSGPMIWQNNQTGSSLVNSIPYPTNNNSISASPRQLQISPYIHLLQQEDVGSTARITDPAKMATNDPDIESIKRQVQIGLFATPGTRRDD